MGNAACFAVHWFRGANNLASKGIAYGLVAQTDTQNRHASAKGKNSLYGNASLLRCAGPG